MKKLLLAVIALLTIEQSTAQYAMQNVVNRDQQSLNGRWYALPDVMDRGIGDRWGMREVWREKNPTRLDEVCFEGGLTLDVPGDWNSQHPELLYYEEKMWYKRNFTTKVDPNCRYFLHFAAANVEAKAFMNNKELGSHLGGFTPFQFEVTDIVNSGDNEVVVMVSNVRRDGIAPGVNFDWWNYGGLTRDVTLVSTPKTFIKDYWIRLKKGSQSRVMIDLKLDGEDSADQTVTIYIGKLSKKLKTDERGEAQLSFDAKLDLWSPQSPTLYDIKIETEFETLSDKIGFRSFETVGTEIMLNGEPVFLKGVNMHEEIGKDERRSVGEQDAEYLVRHLKDLGCNFVRLTHYPADEHLVRKCEERGLMIWEEIPVRGSHLDFTNTQMKEGAERVLYEMIERDKNRCGVVMWSISNETPARNADRNEFLKGLIERCRNYDNTRAVTMASNQVYYPKGVTDSLEMIDPLAKHVDIVGVNKYQGWYMPWLSDPATTQWKIVDDRPIIMSEFGAGAVYGKYGDDENPDAFSDRYMADAYRNYLASFENIPNLRGTCPWVLFDFKSLRRSQAMYQKGWNRKGLLSPMGEKKEAWFIMNEYYKTK